VSAYVEEVAPLTIGAREFYEMLGIGRSTFYEALRRGDLPVKPIRVGRTVRFPRVAVMRLLEPEAMADQSGDQSDHA